MPLHRRLSFQRLTAPPDRLQSNRRWSTGSPLPYQRPDVLPTAGNEFAYIGRQERLAGESSIRALNHGERQSKLFETPLTWR